MNTTPFMHVRIPSVDKSNFYPEILEIMRARIVEKIYKNFLYDIESDHFWTVSSGTNFHP